MHPRTHAIAPEQKHPEALGGDVALLGSRSSSVSRKSQRRRSGLPRYETLFMYAMKSASPIVMMERDRQRELETVDQ